MAVADIIFGTARPAPPCYHRDNAAKPLAKPRGPPMTTTEPHRINPVVFGNDNKNFLDLRPKPVDKNGEEQSAPKAESATEAASSSLHPSNEQVTPTQDPTPQTPPTPEEPKDPAQPPTPVPPSAPANADSGASGKSKGNSSQRS